MQKLRVGVFMGGKSIEHEVSFNSGRTVCDHLDNIHYIVVPIFQTIEGTLYILPQRFLHRGKTTDFTSRLAQEAKEITWDTLSNHIDFAFIAMHGQYGEDGSLQGFLEILRIPYIGSKILASALSMDKIIQKKILRSAGIATPKGFSVPPNIIYADDDLLAIFLHQELASHNLKFPLVVKPSCEGSSLGVSLVKEEDELVAALKAALNLASKKQPILVEEKLCGMEFSCICLTNEKGEPYALLPTEVVPETASGIYCYSQKYMPGRATKFTPARCSSEQLARIQEAALQSIKALEMSTVARIDGFLTDDNTIVVMDTNSIPGMGPASFLFREAAESNMNHTQVINHLIKTELEAYKMHLPFYAKTESSYQKKLRIAVIMGGSSSEREISLESGRNVIYKLSTTAYDILPLFLTPQGTLYKLNPKQIIRSSTTEIQQMLDAQDIIPWHMLPEIIDFAFIALHGGEGENGSIQGAFEMLEIPYNGSGVLTSALCMNKYKTNIYLQEEGFQIPRHRLISRNEFLAQPEASARILIQEIGLPLIVKPHDDGCSFMVQKVCDSNMLIQAMQTLFATEKKYALVEECIQGMELTVGCIGNNTAQAFPPSQTVTSKAVLSLEEKFLPGAGENKTPAPLTENTLSFIRNEIERAYISLGCKGYARIDCFYQEAEQSPTGTERIVFLEVNTLPGLTPATVLFHQAAEVSIRPTQLLDLIINLGFEEHAEKKHHRTNTAHTLQSSERRQEFINR